MADFQDIGTLLGANKSIKEYIGLSTDTKPTGVAIGSRCLEYDTGLTYITYDGTNWVLTGYTEQFSGAIYENEDTATGDTARRFETSSKKLRDVIIKVTDYAQLFGDSSNQRLKVAAGGSFGLTKVDISTLYFKNAVAGSNGTVNILAVEE